MSPITITGRLSTDAHAGFRSDGTCVLTIWVRAPGSSDDAKPLALRAAKEYGSGNTAGFAAKSRAHHLKRGVTVIVSARGLKRCRGGIELLGVDHIAAPDIDGMAVRSRADADPS